MAELIGDSPSDTEAVEWLTESFSGCYEMFISPVELYKAFHARPHLPVEVIDMWADAVGFMELVVMTEAYHPGATSDLLAKHLDQLKDRIAKHKAAIATFDPKPVAA